jgi:hypothetical protein
MLRFVLYANGRKIRQREAQVKVIQEAETVMGTVEVCQPEYGGYELWEGGDRIMGLDRHVLEGVGEVQAEFIVRALMMAMKMGERSGEFKGETKVRSELRKVLGLDDWINYRLKDLEQAVGD